MDDARTGSDAPPLGPAATTAVLAALGLAAVAAAIGVVTFKAFELDRFFVPKELALHAGALVAAVALGLRPGPRAWTRIDLAMAAWVVCSLASAASVAWSVEAFIVIPSPDGRRDSPAAQSHPACDESPPSLAVRPRPGQLLARSGKATTKRHRQMVAAWVPTDPAVGKEDPRRPVAGVPGRRRRARLILGDRLQLWARLMRLPLRQVRRNRSMDRLREGFRATSPAWRLPREALLGVPLPRRLLPGLIRRQATRRRKTSHGQGCRPCDLVQPATAPMSYRQ